MERLRKLWWIPLITTVLCSLAIVTLAPRYAAAQTANDAAGFIKEVADAGKNRTSAAGVADMAFCVSYFTLGIALVRSSWLTKLGAALIGLGAIADITENATVISGARRGKAMTNEHMDAIRSVGTVKWAFVIAGLLVFLPGLVLSRKTSSRAAAV